MIVSVTLNPCLDKTLVVPRWQPGDHQVRGREVGYVVGGKGVNVLRGLGCLGQRTRPALFLGGEVERACDRLLRQQDRFDPIVTWTEAPTREILTVRTEGSADQTAFFDPNPVIRAEECDDLMRRLEGVLPEADWCVMSGSSPCGATDGCYAALVRLAREAGVRTLVDTYGACFLPVMQAGPDVVKMNQRECESGWGHPLLTGRDVRESMRWMLGFPVTCAAITFGSRGCAVACNDDVWGWRPPKVEVVNPIGAGDAMAAGWIDAWSRGEDPRQASRWGMACAVASVAQWNACSFARSEAERMLPLIQACALDDLVSDV